MTKKTIFKCAAMLLCAAASFNANAQVNADNIITTKNLKSNVPETALNIVVDNAIEVVPNPDVTSVGFRLASAEDFRVGKSQIFQNAFKVTSNIPYSISVKTKDAEMTNQTQPDVTKKIPVSAISMEIDGTSGEALGTVAAKKALSASSDAILTKGAKETIEQAFTLKVSKTTDNSTAFLVPGGLYTTTLFITATQD